MNDAGVGHDAVGHSKLWLVVYRGRFLDLTGERPDVVAASFT